MKTFKILLFVIISAALIGTAFLLEYSDSVIISQQNVSQDMYVIGVYDERIAVFAQGDKVPIEIFDVNVKNLPEKDQTELREGIRVANKTRLRELIEDYTS